MNRTAVRLVFVFTVLVTGPTFGQSLDQLMLLGSGHSQRATSSNPDLNSNGDDRSLAPGETLVLADLEGPGVIRHIWMTVGSGDPFFWPFHGAQNHLGWGGRAKCAGPTGRFLRCGTWGSR